MTAAAGGGGAAKAKALFEAKVAKAKAAKDLFAPDVSTQCLLLPYEPYPGEAPDDLVGEVMLEELEDNEQTRTQLFLHPDGTISHGQTDGPPPAGFCGLWQCGGENFQMTLSRSFSSSSATLDPSQVGQMSGQIAYTVVRVFEGDVDLGSTGVGKVNGRIDLVREEDAAAWESSGATSIAAFDPLSSIKTPPIGYFVLDTNTDKELESED